MQPSNRRLRFSCRFIFRYKYSGIHSYGVIVYFYLPPNVRASAQHFPMRGCIINTMRLMRYIMNKFGANVITITMRNGNNLCIFKHQIYQILEQGINFPVVHLHFVCHAHSISIISQSRLQANI